MTKGKPDPELIWPLLEALSSTAELIATQTARHGEDSSTVKLLALLRERGKLRPSQLAQQLGLTPAAVTRRLRTLADADQVELEPDPADSRSYTVQLAEAGGDRLDAFAESLTTRFGDAVSDWERSEIDKLTALLNRLLKAAERPDDTGSSPSRAQPWWRRR